MEIKEDVSRDTFKSTLPIQIRFNDIDALGHINNNIYFSYFDLGKVDYLESLKASSANWTDGIIVIAHIDVDFMFPVFAQEQVVVDTKVTKIGTKSIVFLQQVRNVSTNEIKCRCNSVVVGFNPTTQQAMAVPETWRYAISEFEGVDF